MTKDDKINIKLEVCRDKTSGKLSIMARFDENAPNIFKDKGDYFWMPTTEEKDFLNEAFAMIPSDAPHITSDITHPKPEEEIDLSAEPELEPEKLEEKPEDVPPIEQTDEPSVFGESSDDKKDIDIEEDVEMPSEDIPTESDEPILEEPKSDELEPEEKEEGEGIIVEADADAIDAALKKHIEKDKSIVEADEQTIVDKVLSQKKKGKWSKH